MLHRYLFVVAALIFRAFTDAAGERLYTDASGQTFLVTQREFFQPEPVSNESLSLLSKRQCVLSCGDEACCGTGCIPTSYSCCTSGGGCSSSTFCCNDESGGCCPKGKTCSGDYTCRSHVVIMSTGAIVGVVLGAIALVAAVIRCCIVISRRHRTNPATGQPIAQGQRVKFVAATGPAMGANQQPPPMQQPGYTGQPMAYAPQQATYAPQPAAYTAKTGATVSSPQEYNMPSAMPPAYLQSNDGRQTHV